jgi:hypothetical protein
MQSLAQSLTDSTWARLGWSSFTGLVREVTYLMEMISSALLHSFSLFHPIISNYYLNQDQMTVENKHKQAALGGCFN